MEEIGEKVISLLIAPFSVCFPYFVVALFSFAYFAIIVEHLHSVTPPSSTPRKSSDKETKVNDNRPEMVNKDKLPEAPHDVCVIALVKVYGRNVHQNAFKG